jgi:transcription-repair coupling factor (superfamily II helicase)
VDPTKGQPASDHAGQGPSGQAPESKPTISKKGSARPGPLSRVAREKPISVPLPSPPAPRGATKVASAAADVTGISRDFADDAMGEAGVVSALGAAVPTIDPPSSRTRDRGLGLNPILESLPDQVSKVSKLVARWQVHPRGEPIWVDGVRGVIRGLLAAAVAKQRSPLLMILPAPVDPDVVATDLAAFGIADCVVLPLSADEGTPESLRDQDYAARMRVLEQLRHWQPPKPLVVLAHVCALLQRVPAPSTLQAGTRTLRVGQSIDPAMLRGWMAEAGFAATTSVELPGEFSQRGGILDVFAPGLPQPVRIEFFGEEIESIRYFDLGTQRSVDRLQELELAAVDVKHQEEGLLLDYLPSDAGVIVVDLQACEHVARAFLERIAWPERFATWQEVITEAQRRPLIVAAELAATSDSSVVHLPTGLVDQFIGDLDAMRRRVDQLGSEHQVLVVADTHGDLDRLSELLRPTLAASSGKLSFEVAGLSGGFRLIDPPLLVLTGAELFHRSPVRRARPKVASRAIDSFMELRPGDLVVHLSHGIGLYRGLGIIERNGQPQEHLTIEFDGGTKIYVPATKIGLVQKYVGGTKGRPKLARIGGQSWIKQKKAAEEAVSDMASDLLELQARRASRMGIAFHPDSDWQRQFDAQFPYTETPDQLSAISAIKADMQSVRPADRLICGDVGFGKTEVAMRAAFKAVDNGFQVAVLVPTTVLAEQHFKSFCSRMAEFPFDIRRMSRFSSSTEQRETLERLKQGSVDVVIGTHRLASEDVEFANLGLVIVDEEQRFGVHVKERLKTRHSNVDVVTLSATPIPRTLHMSLVGVRDISNLETPPEERLAVETRVTRWDDTLIRNAILRELNRGGQIYFVHNRVGDIGEIAAKLQRIVPEVKMGIGHGQMDEHDLERVMVDFIDHRFDMLLATTIIESGLDIPSANTIFVHEAERYGLADLHQLRGRVGRYKHQAYCYLLVDKHKHITPNAAKRLRAIEEYSQMGAGFAIAMRDLEIRGAGNLLGTQQSGHIAAVGYELYCQLLEDAVRKLQHLPPRRTVDVEVELPVSALVPSDYIGDLRHKVDLYRRLSQLEDIRQVDLLRGELRERFGPVPILVERLLQLFELRLDAAVWQVRSVTTQGEFLVLTYGDRRRLEQLKKRSKRPVRIVDDKQAFVPIEGAMIKRPDGEGWLLAARELLR